jgi:hypothetical protein
MSTKTLLAAAAGLLSVFTLAACATSQAETASEPPAVVQEIAGSDVKKVTLTVEAAKAINITTAPVVQGPGPGQLTIPYAALIYYLDGSTWTYTATGEREFVRVPITVASISGMQATLSEGPRAGTPVVVVGAPEVLGAELEIDGEQ